MQTISGEGWSMDYIMKNGKLAAMKYHGTAKDMKTAMTALNEAVAKSNWRNTQ